MIKSPDDAIVKKALDAADAIEREASLKRAEQLGELHAALKMVRGRISELVHQEQQLRDAISRISGHARLQKKRASKESITELRKRMEQWLQGRAGQKFAADELRKQFPEVPGGNVGLLLKPLLDSGAIEREGKTTAARYMASVEKRDNDARSSIDQ